MFLGENGGGGGVYMIMSSPLAIASLIKVFEAVFGISQSNSVPYMDQKCMHASLHYTLPAR